MKSLTDAFNSINPFIILAFILILLFFIPSPATYNLLKVAVAIMVVAYGLSLGAFKKRTEDSENIQLAKIAKKQLKEVRKELEKIENEKLS